MEFESQSYPNSTDPVFSILIPSWNNLPYLKLCVRSLREHSTIPLQIIVHVNESTDDTLAWVQAEKIDHTFTSVNAGVCWSLNAASTLAKGDYISFLNDDMYALPGWDTSSFRKFRQLAMNIFSFLQP